MKRILLYLANLLILHTLSVSSNAQTNSANETGQEQVQRGKDDEGKDDEQKNNVLFPLLSYNFSGNKEGLSNLTPIINYGWQRELGSWLYGNWTLTINPYVAGQIDIDDSTSFVPGLMLPGTGGLRTNLFWEAGNDNAKLILFPANFGIKLIANFLDSSKTIAQHNFRTGAGFKMKDYFMIGAQYTFAWHTLTSESESNFKQLLKSKTTDIQYLTITLDTYLKRSDPTNSILFAEWRGLVGENFKGLPNTKILTIGFRKEFSLDNIAPAK
jgi:hypothetical protein